jgi:DNA-binding IclR family transcriptional regulator
VNVRAACIAAPILGSDGYTVGAISVSGLAARMPDRQRPALELAVSRRCAAISAQLGFLPSGNAAWQEASRHE